jgi:hypothetical protein
VKEVAVNHAQYYWVNHEIPSIVLTRRVKGLTQVEATCQVLECTLVMYEVIYVAKPFSVTLNVHVVMLCGLADPKIRHLLD